MALAPMRKKENFYRMKSSFVLSQLDGVVSATTTSLILFQAQYLSNRLPSLPVGIYNSNPLDTEIRDKCRPYRGFA